MCDSEEEKELHETDEQLKECSDIMIISDARSTFDETTEYPVKRQKRNDEESPKINPFAKFAHQDGPASSHQESTTSFISRYHHPQMEVSKTKEKKCKVNPPRMNTLSPAEVENVKKKWYGFLQQDDLMEDQRFQLLVAARLHARCQDKAVHRAMTELRKSLLPMPFSAEVIAADDPDKLQESISNLQFYSVKAKQIVQAATEIVSQYDGQVPESEADLLKLTGIGTVFADLLATINTRTEHQKRRGDNVKIASWAVISRPSRESIDCVLVLKQAPEA